MELDYVKSVKQTQTEMDYYRKVFDVVRLVEEDDIDKMRPVDDNAQVMPCCHCFDFWNKQHPCDDCVSLRALHDKSQATKIEILENEIYQIFARYTEIDGSAYVMELIKRIDPHMILDMYDYEKLVSRISGYNDKLYKDALTGAYNRRYYEEEMKKLSESAGVAMIDLDDFKLYNDTFGHSAGDMVLNTTAEIIRRCIRRTDTLIRYGGDEFLLIMPGVGKEIFNKKLRQIQNMINSAALPGSVHIPMSVSIGGVILNAGDSMELAVENADRLMYIAKKHKNMVVTDNESDLINSDEGKQALEAAARQQILIVDDSEFNRHILSDMLGDEYRILEAKNGRECIEILQEPGADIALILLDIVMPEMDGFEVLSYMNGNGLIESIPVLMISSEDSSVSISRAYELGASDYISRPFDKNVVEKHVLNMIKLYAKQRRLTKLVTQQIYEKEKNSQIMIGILSQIVEFRNGESGRHVRHINVLTRMLLERLVQKTDKYMLSWSDQYMIATASALHDIGKIGIDEKILNKNGKLTDEEFEVMKSHTVIGASMLQRLELYRDEMLVKFARQICRWHHERYDGRGYPDGLKGDDIPISAQVVSLADVYDALVSRRVYKEAYTHEKAMEMIENGECGQFNPVLLECLHDIKDMIRDEIRYDEDDEAAVGSLTIDAEGLLKYKNQEQENV